MICFIGPPAWCVKAVFFSTLIMEATDSQRAKGVWMREKKGGIKTMICLTRLFEIRKDKKRL